MPVIEKIIDDPNPDRESYTFDCPGCGMGHQIWTKNPDGRPEWGFNGDIDKPTFTPSLMVQWTWGAERVKKVCHSFITDGRIRFLTDCTHEHAGKTLDLPQIEL